MIKKYSDEELDRMDKANVFVKSKDYKIKVTQLIPLFDSFAEIYIYDEETDTELWCGESYLLTKADKKLLKNYYVIGDRMEYEGIQLRYYVNDHGVIVPRVAIFVNKLEK